MAGRSVGAIPQSMASSYGPSIDEILFRYQPGREAPTFTRSSEGRYRDAGLVQQTAASDILRDQHYVRNENGILVRATRLEAARTNRYTRSEELEHGDWSKSNVSITQDDATAPDNNTTADKVVEDDTAAGSEHKVDQSLPTGNISDDTDQTASVHGVDAERNWLAIRTTDQNGDTATSWVDLSDGSKGTTAAGHTVRVESGWTGDHHRVAVTFDSDSGATTPTVEYLLADADGSVSYDGDGSSGLHLWGFQFEADSSFPSSYTPTTSSAVSRAADDLSFPIGFGPQEMTIYAKLVDQGTTAGGDFYWMIGDPANEQITARAPEGQVDMWLDDGSNRSDVTNLLSPSVGDVIEQRLVVKTNGDVEGGASLNGGTEETGTGSGASLPNSFSTSELFVGQRQDGLAGAVDMISGPIIAPGVKTMDECRALAGTA